MKVKDERYIIHSNEITIIQHRDPPKSLRTQYQVQNETKIRKNQKLSELIVMN